MQANPTLSIGEGRTELRSSTQSAPVSKGRRWSARIMGGIAVLFLLFDGVIHVMNIPPVKEGFAQLGFPENVGIPIGIIQLLCLLLYVVPRTSVLGAILLTGYLGGAVATNVRIDAPLFSHVLSPVYVAVLLWGALYLSNSGVRAIIPVRR